MGFLKQAFARARVKSALTGASGKIDDAKGNLKKIETSIREILGEILIMIKVKNTD